MHATRRFKNFGLTLGLSASLCLSAWAAPNFKTLTDAPRDTSNNGSMMVGRERELRLSDGKAVFQLPGSGWLINRAGAMGADYELFNAALSTRMGFWAGQSIENKAPRALVGEWVNNLRTLTGGDWSTPKSTSIGGTPVVQAFGVDAFGNYYYRVISYTKFGVNFAIALRTPFSNRWNNELQRDIGSIVTNSHVGMNYKK
jgi:hypothetical protein